ncbi:hypothetical protein BDZ97DRAFT_1831794 [Flammula alnicola]|nr:hypothetical protein BDZ97DRAFT_1831794 [Flammula alnicola]
MVWATNRTTMRGEDIAYSLMGIFGVSFPIAYGEGAERAFFWLIEAILISFQDVSDVLNWAGRPISRKIHSSRLIPSTPWCYLKKENHIQTYPGWDEVALPSIPITLTHLGVQVRMLLFSCIKSEHLPHYNYSPTFYGEAEVQEDRSSNNYYFPQPPLDPSGRHRTSLSSVLGVWDFIEGGNHVEMSPTNLAVLLKIRDSAKIYNMNGLEAADISSACETENVAILRLKLRNCPTFRVDKKDLGWHGMNVLTLHL